MTSQKTLIEKLDLTEHIEKLKKFFARPKEIILEGDINIHSKIINEFCDYKFSGPKNIQNLDNALLHIQKQGVLKLFEIYEFIKIVSYFEYLKGQKFEGKIAEWLEKIEIPSEISKIIQLFDEKGEIKNGNFEHLDNINFAISKNKDEIKSSLARVLHTQKLTPYFVDHQIHLVNGEECLLLRGGFSHFLKGHIIDRSSGGFFYVIPHSVADLKQKRDDLTNHKIEILYKIAKEISTTFGKFWKFLNFINREFDKLDHYLARVAFAVSNDLEFILPSNSKKHELKDFCHPALMHPKPITIDFSKKIILLTGVNAGGKTMVLKSILSAVFMAKYLIPMRSHKSSSIPNFKAIEAILDDPQNVKNDISTFAGRMVNFSKLFSKESFIAGVDEIELGTDSDEAASLFKVIIEELAKKECKIIITTHHKRLAALMSSNNEVELFAALYDEENERPTYDFLQGTIGKSYAFETASRYGIPRGVIKNAKVIYGEDKDRLNDLIHKSSQLEISYKQKLTELDEQISKYKNLNENLKDEIENTKNELSSQKSKLQSEYKLAVDEARKAIKITEAREGHKILNNAHKLLPKKEEEQARIIPQTFEVGNIVKYKSNRGIIKSIKGEKAFVELEDGFRIQVITKDLKKMSENLPKPKQKLPIINVEKPKSGGVSLDLHGLRSEEAIEQLDKFISDALVSGFDEILVYHGIGTGKLSYAVKEFLRAHPKIKSFRDGLPSEGGFGAKVIIL